MKRKICLFFSLLFIIVSYAQRNTDPTGNDKILAKKLKEQFPDDDVALEYHKDFVSFLFNKSDTKVFANHNEEKAYINLSVRSDIHDYVFYDGESSVEEFKVSYRNKKKTNFYIKDEAYTSSDLFHNDTRVKFVSLDFPVNAYRYYSSIKKKYKDIKYFTKLYFNQNYPVATKTISIEVPDWLELELKEINFDGFNIQKRETKNPREKTKTYIYTMKYVNAMYDETNTPGPTYIYPHLLILAKSKSFDGKKTAIFESTEHLYSWYKSLVDELKNDTSTIKLKVEELTKNATSDEEKIKNIYYWVQDNIRYIAFEDGIAGFKPDEAANVFNKKYGDCKGMANLIKHMLIEADFDARLTWIGTKRIAYDYSIASLAVDNHMICTLFKDGKTIFLDGTEKFNAYGEYADRIQGKEVLIENGDDFIIKKVPETNAAFNKETITYELTIEDDLIKGNAKRHFKGESRSNLLYYFNTLKTDHKQDFLEWYLNKGNSNIKVSNINTSKLDNREIDIDINYDLTVKNAVSDFDGTIYLDLDFDKQLSGLDFEKRKTDYIFSSKKDLNFTTKLHIPNGYKIDNLPKGLKISSKNYEMEVTFKTEDNILYYNKTFKLNSGKIETSDFKEWNNFISKLNTIYNEQLIFTKH